LYSLIRTRLIASLTVSLFNNSHTSRIIHSLDVVTAIWSLEQPVQRSGNVPPELSGVPVPVRRVRPCAIAVFFRGRRTERSPQRPQRSAQRSQRRSVVVEHLHASAATVMLLILSAVSVGTGTAADVHVGVLRHQRNKETAGRVPPPPPSVMLLQQTVQQPLLQLLFQLVLSVMGAQRRVSDRRRHRLVRRRRFAVVIVIVIGLLHLIRRPRLLFELDGRARDQPEHR